MRSRNDCKAETLWINEAWTHPGTFKCPRIKASDFQHMTHLKNLGVRDISPNNVKILIGANIPKAHLQTDVREGSHGEPIAVHTILGWCLLGGVDRGLFDAQANVNFVVSEEVKLNEQRNMPTESLGVTVDVKNPTSVENYALITVNDGANEVERHFETNCVTEMCEASQPEQWKYLPSSKGPADVVTGGLPAAILSQTSIWLPAFLCQPQTWPLQPEISTPADDDGICKSAVCFYSSTSTGIVDGKRDFHKVNDIQPERFSSWNRLQYCVAWVLRAAINFSTDMTSKKIARLFDNHLLTSEFYYAEIREARLAQTEVFIQDYKLLQNSNQLERNIQIRSLNPFFNRSIESICVGAFDNTALTSNHFLNGGAFYIAPISEMAPGDVDSSKRKRCKVFNEHVWKHWKWEYLRSLTVRNKWKADRRKPASKICFMEKY